MIRNRRASSIALFGLVLFALWGAPVAAQHVSGEDSTLDRVWRGRELVSKKGCLECHGWLGGGDKVAPDLVALGRGRRLEQVFAALWNHVPQMAAHLREGKRLPSLTPDDLSDLFSFFLAMDYVGEAGDASRGEELLADRGCLHCHEKGIDPGGIGPPLVDIASTGSPVALLVRLFKAYPVMSSELRSMGMTWPQWSGRDMADLTAALSGFLPAGRAPHLLEPGRPDDGRRQFDRLGCVSCHGDAGGKKPWATRSAAENAAALLNHLPKVREGAAAKGIDRVGETDMVDLLAFLTWDGATLEGGDATRGWEIFSGRRCVSCHRPAEAGGISKPYAELARFANPYDAAAAMISHGENMILATRLRDVAWPRLTEQEALDLLAFLAPKEGKR